MESAKMNIYQKLIEVRKAVPYLKKANQGYQFKYVSSSDTLGALRESMDTNGLLLVPRVVSHEIRDHSTRKGDHEYFTILNVEYTWVNAESPAETVVCTWQGCGLDDGEKGTGKALTYAEKYFLLKFFNIATDKDDPDDRQPDKQKARSSEPANATPMSSPAPAADPNEDAMRREIQAWGMELAGGVESEYRALLKRETMFTDKDTKEEKFREDVARLKGKWLKQTHAKIHELHDKAFPANDGLPF